MILSRSTLAAPRSTPSPQAHAVLRAATATASPRTSERVVAEGQDIAVLNGNPAGSVSLYRQLTSDEDGEQPKGGLPVLSFVECGDLTRRSAGKLDEPAPAAETLCYLRSRHARAHRLPIEVV